jgi:thioredoxin reductase
MQEIPEINRRRPYIDLSATKVGHRANYWPWVGLELKRYPAATQQWDSVTAITRCGECFSEECEKKLPLHARKVLLTTGLRDDVPRLEGIDRLYGRSVHYCPYCDGFEHQDQAIAVYGEATRARGWPS